MFLSAMDSQTIEQRLDRIEDSLPYKLEIL